MLAWDVIILILSCMLCGGMSTVCSLYRGLCCVKVCLLYGGL